MFNLTKNGKVSLKGKNAACLLHLLSGNHLSNKEACNQFGISRVNYINSKIAKVGLKLKNNKYKNVSNGNYCKYYI